MAEAAAAALTQGGVERVLAGVAEGRVAEIVAEPDRLGQVLVQAQRPGDRAGDPAGLQRMGEPGPVVVALGGDEDLGLVLEPAEGLGVDDAVAVALERRPQRAVGLLDRAASRIGPGRVLREERVLPGLDAVGESGGNWHRSIIRSGACGGTGRVSTEQQRGGSVETLPVPLRGSAQLDVCVVLQGLADGPLDLAQGQRLGRRCLGERQG